MARIQTMEEIVNRQRSTSSQKDRALRRIHSACRRATLPVVPRAIETDAQDIFDCERPGMAPSVVRHQLHKRLVLFSAGGRKTKEGRLAGYFLRRAGSSSHLCPQCWLPIPPHEEATICIRIRHRIV